MNKLIFLDTETTSLDAATGEVWEVAVIERITSQPDTGDEVVTERSYVWQLPTFHFHASDPQSLRINKFHQRRWRELPAGDAAGATVVLGANWQTEDNQAVVPLDRVGEWAKHFVSITYGAHLVGNVVSFDEERLRRLLLMVGEVPMWHYHIIDVEPLIAGRLALEPPWKSSELSEAIGIPVPDGQHEALADARWAMDMYDQVMKIVPLEGWERDVHDGVMRMRSDAEG